MAGPDDPNPEPEPPGRRDGGAAAQVRLTQVQVWDGQFPPPDAIERYEQILPGAFDRIISMAERAQDRQFEENRHVQGLIAEETRRGQYLGTVVTLVALAGGIYCASIRQGVVASVLVGVPVLSVAKALFESARPGRRGSAPPRG